MTLSKILITLAAALLLSLALNAAEKVVTTVSDSLTNSKPKNWVDVLSKLRSDIRVQPEAHGGWSTKSYFKEKFKGRAFANLPERADVAIILIGSNNLFEDMGGSAASVKEAVEGVQKIEKFLREKYPKVKIILAAPPSCVPERWQSKREDRGITKESPEWIRKLGQQYKTLAADKGWEFVDLYPLIKAPDHFVDAAHPGDEGNAIIAEAMKEALDRLLPVAKDGG